MKVSLTKLTHWLLLIAVLLYIITGLGITQYQTIEKLTFGLLTKSLAFRIHSGLLIPFIILLVAHVWFVLGKRFRGG